MKSWAVEVALVAGLVATGCGGGAGSSAGGAQQKAAAPAKLAADPNACHLLTHEEVAALVERKVRMADQTEAGDDFSTCDWEDESGQSVFGLTAHWSGGKRQWETWRMAQGLGDAALKKAEGVSASEAVEQGLVPGLGDGAYFSEVLPSLVLKGDTLFEIRLTVVPKAKTKFRDLAARLLAKTS